MNDFEGLYSNFRISYEEYLSLGSEAAIQYFKYHHIKNNGRSSILFVDSDLADEKLLYSLADESKIIKQSKVSPLLTFVCAKNHNSARIIYAKSNGAIILSPSHFGKVFEKKVEYNLFDSESIFNPKVHKIFRIPIPLSNFNNQKSVPSFANSDIYYSLNLFNQVCNCQQFLSGNMSSYFKGDIRRLCKHLMKEYINSFGENGLSEIQLALIEGFYPVKERFHSFKIANVNSPIIANYDVDDEWWNLYVPNKHNKYVKYGFSMEESRFAHGNKPHGYVTELRNELKKLQGILTPAPKKKIMPKKTIYLAKKNLSSLLRKLNKV